jgi:hypothetical protein
MMDSKFFCAEVSRRSSEGLLGTATASKYWLLVEYNTGWQRDVQTDNSLSDRFNSWLSRFINDDDQHRSLVLFIKRSGERQQGGKKLFIVRTGQKDPVIYQFTFESYDEMLALDALSVAFGDEDYQKNVINDPLYLICTHGKWDKCCAKYGIPIYRELVRKQMGNSVWEVSHVGGLYYGHLDVVDALKVVEAYDRGEIFLQKYRGRSVLSFFEQAAEILLRQQTGLCDIDALQIISSKMVASDEYAVRYITKGEQQEHTIIVQRYSTGVRCYGSCDAKREMSERSYRLI